MAVNRGKSFEHIVKQSFESVPDTAVYRLHDDMSGFKGVKNPCDFFIYHKPVLYAIECKATNKPSLPFSNITDYQWTELLRMSKISGVVAGIMCWFVNENTTLFIPIQILEMLKQNGAKSIRYDADEFAIIQIPGEKKRIFWNYDMSVLFQSIPM